MSQAESAPEATAEPPAAEAAPELPAVPPPSLDAAESAPPAVPEEAAPVPAPQAGTPAPETEQAENGATLTPPPPPAAPAEPQSESAASDLPAAPQTSALTPGSEEDLLRLTFAEGSADLNEEAKDSLRALAQTLLEDGNARVQLLAYASSADDSASRARRLSLSRALAVRAYLIDQGVRSTRMDVRALGSKAEDGPSDRVDILPAQR
jgi:outer membrane protein OmpA-like peptidoglycan-associated protein